MVMNASEKCPVSSETTVKNGLRVQVPIGESTDPKTDPKQRESEGERRNPA